jgi:hypothetical protein
MINAAKYRHRTDPRRTLVTNAGEQFHTISDSTLRAIAQGGRRRMARDDIDDSYLDRGPGPPYGTRSSPSRFNGPQGRNRPGYSTPTAASARRDDDEISSDQDPDPDQDAAIKQAIELMQQHGLSDQDIEHVIGLYLGKVEAEDTEVDQSQKTEIKKPPGRGSPPQGKGTEAFRRAGAEDQKAARVVQRANPKLSLDSALAVARLTRVTTEADRRRSDEAAFIKAWPMAGGINIGGDKMSYAAGRDMQPRTAVVGDRRSVNSCSTQSEHVTPHRQDQFSHSRAAVNLSASAPRASGSTVTWRTDAARISPLASDGWR